MRLNGQKRYCIDMKTHKWKQTDNHEACENCDARPVHKEKMSSFTNPNRHQPVDYIKQDHLALVETLKRKELKLAVKRHAYVCHNEFRQEHNGTDFGSTSSDDWDYPKNPEELVVLDNLLLDHYFMLRHYYKYPKGYFKILNYHKIEQLPIDWEKCTHDGFWGSDPSIKK